MGTSPTTCWICRSVAERVGRPRGIATAQRGLLPGFSIRLKKAKALSSQAMKDTTFTFCSSVPKEMRPHLEQLFFFNERQSDLRDGIMDAIQEAGTPTVMEDSRRIWIGVPTNKTQCLFACTQSIFPVGVALFGRPSDDILWIYHLCVDPKFSTSGVYASEGLILALVEKVREIGLTIRGVSRIRLPYCGARFLSIRR
jgi:hypothetical protein